MSMVGANEMIYIYTCELWNRIDVKALLTVGLNNKVKGTNNVNGGRVERTK